MNKLEIFLLIIYSKEKMLHHLSFTYEHECTRKRLLIKLSSILKYSKANWFILISCLIMKFLKEEGSKK